MPPSVSRGQDGGQEGMGMGRMTFQRLEPQTVGCLSFAFVSLSPCSNGPKHALFCVKGIQPRVEKVSSYLNSGKRYQEITTKKAL